MKRQPLLFLFLLAAATLQGCGLIVIHGRVTKDDLVDRPGFNWQRDSSSHFSFYSEPGTWASRNMDTVKAYAERSWLRCLDLLQEDSPSFTIDYFLVDSRERMNDLISRKTNGQAIINPPIVCAVASDSIKALGPHEVFHVLSGQSLGPTSDWISEGMAVYSDSLWWGMDLHALAHYFQTKGILIPLNDLTTKFRSFDDRITYPEAGSLLRFLYQRYGRTQVEFLWRNELVAFCSSLHTTPEDIEQEWLQAVSLAPIDGISYPL